MRALWSNRPMALIMCLKNLNVSGALLKKKKLTNKLSLVNSGGWGSGWGGGPTLATQTELLNVWFKNLLVDCLWSC